MIIFRITTGRSFTKFPTVNDGVVTDAIQFAQGGAESTFLQSTFNRELGRNRDPNTERGTATSAIPNTEGIAYCAPQEGNEIRDVEKA